MATLNARQRLEDAEREVENHQRAYLHKFGWDCTSNTPGSYWLWKRDFAPEDEQRTKRHQQRPTPSAPSPYGVITATTDLAISITRRVLDEEIDQDGNPETKVITLADLQREHGDSK